MQVLYFNKNIKKFIESVNPLFRPRVARAIELLETYENNLGMPYSKALGWGLFELRIIGESHIRILYAFHGNVAYLLHGFVKKTGKIPKRDLDYVRSQLKELAKI